MYVLRFVRVVRRVIRRGLFFRIRFAPVRLDRRLVEDLRFVRFRPLRDRRFFLFVKRFSNSDAEL
jgi:hypothetical protein